MSAEKADAKVCHITRAARQFNKRQGAGSYFASTVCLKTFACLLTASAYPFAA